MNTLEHSKPRAARTLLAVFVLAVFGWLAAAGAEAATIAASVEHPSMALGQTNRYIVSISNAEEVTRPAPPKVPGLIFSQTPATSNSVQIINGAVSRTMRYEWAFQAERTGAFVIPSWEANVEGKTVHVNEVAVEVSDMPPLLKNQFSLRWKVPDGPVYVGQAIPATLQLFVRAGTAAGLGSAPEPLSEDFVWSDFSEPQQRRGTVDGQAYIVVEWNSVITPIRSGAGDLPVNLLIHYETGERRRDFFGTRAVQEQLRLTSKPLEWTILDLPKEGRPTGFSGAVGEFEVTVSLSARELEAGEPLTLSMAIRGTGNFERIRAPELPESDDWRIYPPRVRMVEDGSPFEGVKTFEYILTPVGPHVTETPPAAFSWFSPVESEWKEMTFPSESVTVLPGANSSDTSTVLSENVGARSPEGIDTPAGLRPNAASLGPKRSLVPAWNQPLFWGVNGGFACLFALVSVAIVRRNRTRRDPQLSARIAVGAAAKAAARKAASAADENDPLAFYTEARRSLRSLVSLLAADERNPESLTWDDLENILQGRDLPPDSRHRLQEIFHRKDAVEFAGWQPSPEELRSDQAAFKTVFDILSQQIR